MTAASSSDSSTFQTSEAMQVSFITRVMGILRLSDPEPFGGVSIDSRLLSLIAMVRSLKFSPARSWSSASEANRFVEKLRAEKAFNESFAKLPIAR